MRRSPIGLLVCTVVAVAASAYAQAPDRPSVLLPPGGESRFEAPPTRVKTLTIRQAGSGDRSAEATSKSVKTVPVRQEDWDGRAAELGAASDASTGTVTVLSGPSFDTTPKPVRTVPVR